MAIESTLQDLVRRSTFIFNGTVEKLNATTMSIVKPTDSTAVVRVDQIIRAPANYNTFAGKGITVRLLKPGTVASGQQVVFFTEAWLDGTSIAVKEVGHLEGLRDVSDLGRQVAGTIQNLADQELQDRIARAELVVAGRVSNVSPVDEERQSGPTSFDDPQWMEAVIQVESVEKGQLSDKSVTILFPASDDLRWYTSPKFREGQDGIWILHRTPIEEMKIDAYTALDARDFHPKDQLERIRQLSKGNR